MRSRVARGPQGCQVVKEGVTGRRCFASFALSLAVRQRLPPNPIKSHIHRHIRRASLAADRRKYTSSTALTALGRCGTCYWTESAVVMHLLPVTVSDTPRAGGSFITVSYCGLQIGARIHHFEPRGIFVCVQTASVKAQIILCATGKRSVPC